MPNAQQKKAHHASLAKRAKRSRRVTVYYETVYQARKLRRIWKRNGPQAAKAWAEAHSAWVAFAAIQKRKEATSTGTA